MLARDSQLNAQLVENGYGELLRSGLACAFYDLADMTAIASRHRLFLLLNTMTFSGLPGQPGRRLPEYPLVLARHWAADGWNHKYSHSRKAVPLRISCPERQPGTGDDFYP